MSRTRFIRVNGRVIPIKEKDFDKERAKQGAVKVAAGASLAVGGASLASKELKKSFKSFRSSSISRGKSKSPKFGPTERSHFRKMAAIKKVKGMKLANKARTGFGLAITLGSALISSGAGDFFKRDFEAGDEIAGAIGTAAGAAVVGLTARKFGVKARGISELFTGFSSKGQRLSKAKIKQISSSGFKQKEIKFKKLRFDI